MYSKCTLNFISTLLTTVKNLSKSTFLERKLTAVNKSLGEVLLAFIKEVLKHNDSENIALYWGDKVTEVDAANIRDRIMAKYPDVAIDIFRGGQLNYHYILSFE